MALSLCSSSVANTGELACDKSRGVGRKLFIFNGEIDAADYATPEAFLNKLIANSKLSKDDSNKVFVINEIQDLADASEADKEGTLGLGYKQKLQEGKPSYNIKVFAGSDLLKRYRTFNNQTVRIIEYDANGVFWVLKSGTKAKGFQAKLFAKGNKMATGQNVEEGVVDISVSFLSASEYIDNCKWVETPTGGNVEDIASLLDVNLAYVSNSTNVHKISMKIAGSNLVEDYNIGPDFGTAIATLDSDFSAKSGAGTPSTALTITSITYDATLEALTVTYDNTAYSSATGNLKLIPPTPTQLDGADVTGIEMLPVTYPKP